ncbi:DUF6152 family protein [Sphingosinicella sp. CPCC 101087]|uniref:DUF6152 family protein n=1 Tax=Sphingosinicella sp. CPCC 101087 TaxID=2497754 RepID=UPI00101C658F|nr:DUF6152 family protein [Sphingosinicella sp. CPCC 101087]
MLRKILIAAALSVAPAAALAHHGWSSYDMERTITHTASLSDVNWGNPHGSARVRYDNATWDVVLAPVRRMESRGLTQAMLGPRQHVTLVGYPRKDGTREMRIERIIVGDQTVELR